MEFIRSKKRQHACECLCKTVNKQIHSIFKLTDITARLKSKIICFLNQLKRMLKLLWLSGEMIEKTNQIFKVVYVFLSESNKVCKEIVVEIKECLKTIIIKELRKSSNTQ
ncbi:hypothetical protein CDIK_0375 [Cucumispora dikerogammari]|nr:hypothetical protein CDIK_0375 [Cucumispora dikerogammari]